MLSGGSYLFSSTLDHGAVLLGYARILFPTGLVILFFAWLFSLALCVCVCAMLISLVSVFCPFWRVCVLSLLVIYLLGLLCNFSCLNLPVAYLCLFLLSAV